MANPKKVTLLLKRGLKKDLPTLAPGEAGFATDTKEFFVGSETGNIPLANTEKVKFVEDKVTGVETSLGNKADKTYVDTELGKKANASSLGNKADKTYVDTELGKKADTTALSNKADKTEVSTLTAQLAESAKMTNVDNFGAKGDGVTDDSISIQNAIDALKNTGGIVQFTHGKTYKVTKAIVLYDNITLSVHQATIKLMAFNRHFIVNECFLDTSVRQRNKNINIHGGTFDASTYSSSTTGLLNLRCVFHHVDNLKIKDATFLSKSGKYMIALGDTNNAKLTDLEFDSFSDGIHLLGKNHNTVIRNVTGSTGDDLVAVTTEDYVDYRFEEGEVKNLSIENVHGSNHTRIVLLGNTKYVIDDVDIKNVRQKGDGAIVTIGSGESPDVTAYVNNVRFDNVFGDSSPTSDTNRILLSHCNMGSISLSNIKNKIHLIREGSGSVGIENLTIKNSEAPIFAESHLTKMNKVHLENINSTVQLAGEKSNVFIKNMNVTGLRNLLTLHGRSVKIVLDNCTLKTTNTGYDPVIAYQGVIDEIKIINSNIKGGGSSSQCSLVSNRDFTDTTSYCKKIAYVDSEVGECKLLYKTYYTGADVTTELTLSNVAIATVNRLIENSENYHLLLKYTNVTINNALNELFRFTTGKKITVYGTGWNSTKDTLIGTITSDCYAQDFPVKAGFLNKVAKGACYNTDSALSCGVGFLVSNGSSWKNVYSGLTY